MIDEIEKLVNDLARPIFVYRLAVARGGPSASLSMQKSAKTTATNAAKEIHSIVMDYRSLAGAFIGSEVEHHENPDPDHVYDIDKDRSLGIE